MRLSIGFYLSTIMINSCYFSLDRIFIPSITLKTAVGTYEKPFVLMYRSMNGFSYIHPLGVAAKPVLPSIHQGEIASGPRNRGF